MLSRQGYSPLEPCICNMAASLIDNLPLASCFKISVNYNVSVVIKDVLIITTAAIITTTTTVTTTATLTTTAITIFDLFVSSNQFLTRLHVTFHRAVFSNYKDSVIIIARFFHLSSFQSTTTSSHFSLLHFTAIRTQKDGRSIFPFLLPQ